MNASQTLVGWQSNPDTRGTLDIIENCLLTILACTWSIQHLNVPRRGDGSLKILGRKAKWAVFTILFPEFILANAVLELVMAINDLSRFSSHCANPPWWFHYIPHFKTKASDQESNQPAPLEYRWTLTHIYFANMGGFYLTDKDTPYNKLKCEIDGKGNSFQGSSPSKAANIVPKDHSVKAKSVQDSSAEKTPPTQSTNRKEKTLHKEDSFCLLTAHNFAECENVFEPLSLSEEDLKDKSKTDYFAKGVAVLQISQLILSLIARKFRHLDFSQLETATLVFAVCGVMTYFCNWYKPHNVRTPILVRKNPDIGFPPNYQHQAFDTLSGILINRQQGKGNAKALERIPNDYIPGNQQAATHYALLVFAIFSAGFGSIHAIAWNFEFPTEVEKILWRTATLVSTLVPPLALLAIPLSQVTRPWGKSDQFITNCLELMREYLWESKDNRESKDNKTIWEAMQRLSDYDGAATSKADHYERIFPPRDSSSENKYLGDRLCLFLENPKLSSNLSKGRFPAQFQSLVRTINNQNGSKKLREEALLNSYPRRVWPFGNFVNQVIVYASSVSYCIARLSIVAVAFSSLRWMPKSVYTTTWTGVIPSWS